jgi:hypothetical protein
MTLWRSSGIWFRIVDRDTILWRSITSFGTQKHSDGIRELEENVKLTEKGYMFSKRKVF